MRTVTFILLFLIAAPLLLAQEKPEGKRAAKKEAAKKEAEKKEAEKKDSEKKDSEKKDSEKKDSEKKSAANETKSDSKKNDSSDIISVSPEREATVHAFVERNHPELADVLKQLKHDKNFKQYQKALRELASVNDKLASIKKSDQDRYELELRAWKLKSRIQLLSARLTMGDNDELKQQLRQALAEQYDVRREVLSYEKHKLHDRLQKIEKDLIDYDARRDSAIEKQFQQLTAVSTPKSKPATGKARTEKTTKNTVSP
jgi:hypothetical protein